MRTTHLLPVLLYGAVSHAVCAEETLPAPIVVAEQSTQVDVEEFERSFAGVVVRRCLPCHNGTDPQGGLDLTTREGMLKGGDSGVVLVAGKPAESYLLERVSDGSMPPEGKGTRLTKDEVGGIAAWIRSGAKWATGRVLSAYEVTTEERAGYDWWSLEPLKRPAVPRLSIRNPQAETVQSRESRVQSTPPAEDSGSQLSTLGSRHSAVRNPIDAFILQKLQERGLEPAPEADRVTLIRRATFDLLGLPPTPDEIDAFIADTGEGAYERLIDRLLASPHYGERWGRHWLDVVRYGESDGYENDKLRPHAWRYRDYVIESLNADKPYTQFIREQLAGDVGSGEWAEQAGGTRQEALATSAVADVRRDGLIATGFLVAGPWDEVQSVGKSRTERLRTQEEEREELIGTIGQTFLGLTLHCARCHDHKFDPIPQVDYYRVKGVFDGVDHAEGRTPGNRPIFTPEEQRRHEEATAPIRERIAALKEQLRASNEDRPAEASIAPGAKLPTTAGKFGRALDARRGNAAASAKTSYHTPPVTVECWTKLDGRSRFNILVAANDKSSGHHWELYSYAGNGEFSVYMPGFSPPEIKSGRDICDGHWHYVAMTFDGETVRLYVDAQLVKETAVSRRKSDGELGNLWFGAYPPQKIGCDGLVDEVRISKMLRPIDLIPDAPFTADEQTIGLWHFDETEGNRFADASAGTHAVTVDATKAEQKAIETELKRAEGELAALPVPTAYVGVRRQPEPTVVFVRGNVKTPGPPVTPGALRAVRTLSPELAPRSQAAAREPEAADSAPGESPGANGESPGENAPEGERRMRFADWVASERHPLTPRVLVNRLWHYHFGVGIVDTPSDFGFNGGRPSHPELLDWLAVEFVESGWSIKQIHRMIMLSATYRRSSQWNQRAAEFDSENRLLWRFPPQRLEGEIVRDAMLAVSGELNRQVGGESFRPFTVTVFLTNFYHLFDSDKPEFNRRTVYRMNINTGRDPLLDSLDCPAPSITMPSRRSTVTTLQALSLMNDSFVLRQSRRFAERVRASAPDDIAAQVGSAYRLAFGRQPSDEELAASTVLVGESDLETLCWVLLNASEFLYVR